MVNMLLNERSIFICLTLLLLAGGVFFGKVFVVQADGRLQQPSPSIPTVTGTPAGPIAKTITDQGQINVRSGPTTDYPIIGFLLAGQDVPVLGRTPGGDWLLVAYPGVPGNSGWVFVSLLVLPQGSVLPIIEPPPTPTPLMTPTIDPTLAAQFIIDVPPTRLPSFTPPPPLVIPTFPPENAGGTSGGVPMGLPIFALLIVGVFGILISLLRGR